ncbi:breast cancer type 2 susceptibility protein homolog isoform X1 [Onthophagus taurus]|uniref:breast cancer type 2 susceptibility protein homolog isoform X1 n=1 Tax=Onthophagus taurus TaxID=166361 RepID=UPI0039BE5B29
MDTCSSNASSVTSLDLESEHEDVPEKPLSPVLSKSKTKNRRFVRKQSSKQPFKTNLDVKFRDGGDTPNPNASIKQFRIEEMNEQQRKQYYNMLCDKNVYRENVNEIRDEDTCRQIFPVREKIVKQTHNESRETVINYRENSKSVKFCTASGRGINISDESLQKGSEIFEDILGAENEGYHVLKNPTSTKNNLSKIPILNQQQTKNVIKMKTTRSTFEEIHVDCYEDIPNESDNYSTISESEDTTSSEIHTDQDLNKIFSNKMFGKQSTSSSPDDEFIKFDSNEEKLIKKLSSFSSKKSQLKQEDTIPVSLGPGDKVNIDAATSKNCVIVTMKPTSIVELHRNTNFNPSNDSVDSYVASRKNSKSKKHSDNFLGFNQNDQEESNKAYIKLTEAIQKAEEQLKVDKKRNEKKLKNINEVKYDDFVRSQKKDNKLKNDKLKNDSTSNQKETESKPKNMNLHLSPNRKDNDDKKSVSSGSNKKRKGTNESIPVKNELKNGNQTIELAPNQKKFKIEIDCNSKFRINISCNGDSETPPNTNDSSKPNSPKSISQEHEPKGKLIKKFINKAQKLYRDIRKSDMNLAEKKDDAEVFKCPLPPSRGKSKKYGDDVHYENQEGFHFSMEPIQFGGFKTAGGKDIKCSEKALNNAKEMYEKTYQDSNVVENKINNNQESTNFGGFKTAGGKLIHFSEKALKKAKQMYEGTHDTHLENKTNESLQPPKDFVDFGGFKSAGEKDIKFSEKVLKRGKEIHDETYENINVAENKVCNQESFQKESINMGGFKTAGGKAMNISEKAMKKAKEMYDGAAQDLKNKTDRQESFQYPNESVNCGEFKNPQSITFAGFQTAGGRNIKFSEKALKKAKQIYDSTDQETEENVKCFGKVKNKKQNESENIQTPKHSGGFKTAGGKDIKFSEKALQKAKGMYNDTFEGDDIAEVPQKEIDLRSKTVNGKQTQISEKTLNTSKKCFENIDNLYSNNINNNHLEKDVNSSKNTVNKSQQLYDILVIEKTNIEDVQDRPIFDMRNCGFLCASGKVINVSEKAMGNAKKLFESIETDQNESIVSKQECGQQLQPKVNVSTNSLNPQNSPKTTTMFGDLSFQAGDFVKNETIQETESLTAAQICHRNSDNHNFCMGDFVPSSENTTIDKIHPSEEIDVIKRNSSSNVSTTHSTQSKKTFQLLEDVYATVNNAIQTIDNKNKKPRFSVSRKRFGMSRFNQINIPNEKIERAKLLFQDDLKMSVKDLKESIREAKSSQRTSLMSPSSQSPTISNHHISSFSMKPQNSSENVTPSVLLCEEMKGGIEDWFSLIDNKIEWMKIQLNELEEKKTYLNFQKESLEKHSKENISPQPGILIRNKEHIKLQLKDLKPNSSSPNNIPELILAITPQNAGSIHFTFTRSSENSAMNVYTTLDAALIVPNVHNIIGFPEIEIAFKTMSGVDPKLIPNGWIANHYKWIIWKLASYERFLSTHLGGSLNVENVVQQLKYRYDREIDKAERPALRRILEKDDVSQKRIVWCVSSVENINNNEIELTDGWYSIPALIDRALNFEVGKGKIKVGTKIVTTGVTLLNCEGCHPLEVPANVKLRICYNSTRKAPWYSKLGYQKCPKPFLIPLQSIKPDGGMIGGVKIQIIRIYPLRFMEKINDSKIWRNFKAEQKRIREFENDRLTKMEKVHYEVQKTHEFEKMQERKKNCLQPSKISKGELLKITCPKTLLALLESANDPDAFLEYLSPSQRANILDYRQTVCMQTQQQLSKKIAEEMEKLKLTKRNVVAILKLLVLDATCGSNKPYQFCLWNPTEDDLGLLKECRVYYVYNILPRYNGELFSTKTTFFKLDKEVSRNKFKRQAYPIELLLDKHCKPPLEEFDTVGVVVYLIVTDSDQSFWLADFLGNIMFVRVRDGPKLCRLLDDISKGDVVSVQNLLYNPPQGDFAFAIANQFTIVNKNTHNYLQEYMDKFKFQLPDNLNKFLGECTAKIEKSSMKVTKLPKETSDVPVLQCGLTNVVDDSSEESFLISQGPTPTDIAMAHVNMDQFI